MEFIQAKTILSKLKKSDPWFGISYNMNLYRGCQHQCIYCDSRSESYQINDFSKIQIKENALQLLEHELKRKKEKGTIGTGSMNDPYMPIEKATKHVRQALQIISNYNFPVHIITKSNLVLRDIDLLNEISKTYAAVSLTITTYDDNLCKIIEPGAPTSTERFAALKELSDRGIYCGVLLMPVLPFINDSIENITSIIQQTAINGGKYIIGWMGMTLRDKQRDYYYKALDQSFPVISKKYRARYGEQYNVSVPEFQMLQNTFDLTCKKLNLPPKMNFYKEQKPEQLSLF